MGPGESGKSQLIYQWFKNDTFQPKFDKILFLYQLFQPLYDVMLKEIEKIEFVRGVNFEFIDSLENNGTKYLLVFDECCQEVCNSREVEKIAVAGRHRGLSTIYIKHNLFHKRKLGRDIELKTTHIVPFKSPREVLQVGRLSVQLGIGLSHVDWYKDATSVPFGHLLIDLSPPTDDRLRYCTNSGKKPSKLDVPEQFKHLRILDDDHTRSLYSPSIPTLFPQVQNTICAKRSERIIRFQSECKLNLLHGSLQNLKKEQVLKYRKQIQSFAHDLHWFCRIKYSRGYKSTLITMLSFYIKGKVRWCH